jgi:hypothetical protein
MKKSNDQCIGWKKQWFARSLSGTRLSKPGIVTPVSISGTHSWPWPARHSQERHWFDQVAEANCFRAQQDSAITTWPKTDSDLKAFRHVLFLHSFPQNQYVNYFSTAKLWMSLASRVMPHYTLETWASEDSRIFLSYFARWGCARLETFSHERFLGLSALINLVQTRKWFRKNLTFLSFLKCPII